MKIVILKISLFSNYYFVSKMTKMMLQKRFFHFVQNDCDYILKKWPPTFWNYSKLRWLKIAPTVSNILKKIMGKALRPLQNKKFCSKTYYIHTLISWNYSKLRWLKIAPTASNILKKILGTALRPPLQNKKICSKTYHIHT